MNRFQRHEIEGGACNDLPGEVIDKYFQANAQTQRFYHLTAKAICQRCPGLTACLDNAIGSPLTSHGVGVTGGESHSALENLRHEHLAHGTPVEELTDRAMDAQDALGALAAARALRAGHFEELPLIQTRR